MARADGSVIINTKIDTKGMNTGIADIQSKMNGLGGTLKKIGGLIATVFAVQKIISFSQECIELGSSLDEVQNVVDVTFGKMSGVIDEFAKNAATSIGLSELAAKQYTSTIGAMYKSMGFTEEAAAGMSMEMTKLAGDMASFYNLDADVAFQKIRSGISGETEPLKQLGINLSEANLEEFRLAQGLQVAYKNMDQQSKALLRYNYLLSVTSDAQGDFARTSDSWANQLRVLKLQFDSIKSTLGAGFINLLTPILQVINKLLVGVAKLANAFKALTELITGKKASGGTSTGDMAETMETAAEAAEDYADATEDGAKATQKAAKAAEQYESPLDHIHKYQEDTANSAADKSGKTKTGTGSAGTVPGVDFGSLASGDTVADTLTKKMEKLWKTIKDGSKPAIDALKRLWSQGLSKLGNFAWQALKDFYDHFLVPVGKWVLGEGIPRLVDAINNGLMKVKWDKINDGLVKLWDALAPFAQTVGEGLLWLYEKVLIPLGVWVANEVVPRFLETLATAITIVDTVLKAAQPGFQWFWDNVLVPIAKWAGGVFLKVWDGINAALKKFAEWCKANPKTIENITVVVIAFFAALAGITVITNIITMIKKIGLLVEAFGTIVTTVNPVVAIIAGLIAIGVLLWKNWDTIKEKAIQIWGAITKWLSDTLDNIKKFWAEKWAEIHTTAVKLWGKIKTAAQEIFGAIKTFLSTTWGSIKRTVSTTWSSIKQTVTTAWSNIKTNTEKIWGTIKTTLSGAWDAIKNKASGVWSAINTTASTTWDKIKTTLSEKWTALKQKASDTFSNIKEIAEKAWKGMGDAGKKSWDTVKSKITSVFSKIGNSATKMRDTIKRAFTAAFEGLVGIVKTPINSVIGVINGLISGIVSGINAIIGVLNSFKISIPSWVPRFGGKRLSFNIPSIRNYPQIPYLASGAVIPPNAPFMAMLGDQKRGNNIEMPENLLRQIVREESGNNSKYEFVAQINRKVLFDELLTEAKLRRGASGQNPFAMA